VNCIAFKPDRGQSVWNLLSEGIVNVNGGRGPNFELAQQWKARDTKSA
jgi:phospholipase C